MLLNCHDSCFKHHADYFLIRYGHLDILKNLFGKVIIAEAVYDEIKAKQQYGYNEIACDFIEVRAIQGQLYKDFLLTELDSGGFCHH